MEVHAFRSSYRDQDQTESLYKESAHHIMLFLFAFDSLCGLGFTHRIVTHPNLSLQQIYANHPAETLHFLYLNKVSSGGKQCNQICL